MGADLTLRDRIGCQILGKSINSRYIHCESFSTTFRFLLNSQSSRLPLAIILVLCAVGSALPSATAASSRSQPAVAVQPFVSGTLLPNRSSALPAQDVVFSLRLSYARADLSVSSKFRPPKRRGGWRNHAWWIALESRRRGSKWKRESCAAGTRKRFRSAQVPVDCSANVEWLSASPLADSVGTRRKTLPFKYVSPVESAKLVQLRDPRRSRGIRLSIYTLAAPKRGHGRLVKSRTSVQVARQLRRARVDTGDGAGRFSGIGDAADVPIKNMTPGASLDVSTVSRVPTLLPKGVTEPDPQYLDRLLAADNNVFTMRAGLEFARSTRGEILSASITRVLPVLQIEKTGPPEFTPGDSVDYQISITNAGHASSIVDASDTVDGSPPVQLSGFSQLIGGASHRAIVGTSVSSTFAQATLHDRAVVKWTDAVGNAYGPLSADFTSLRRAKEGPPKPTITAGPESSTASSVALFEFNGVAEATFECSLDRGEWAACSSPRSVTQISSGNHAFRVRQSIAGSQPGPAAVWEWNVDLDALVCPAPSDAPQIWSDGADDTGVAP